MWGMVPDMQFPNVEGENLAGAPLAFPGDGSAGQSIVLVAFDLKQRDELETWVPFIDRFARAGIVRGLVFATLPRSMRMMKKMIVATMRKVAPTAESHEATFPLFVDIDEFCRALAIDDRSSVHAFMVEGDGSISEHRHGPFTEAAGRAIEAHVKEAT